MKMRIIAPRAGLEATPLAFKAGVLTISLHSLPDVITLCSSLPEV